MNMLTRSSERIYNPMHYTRYNFNVEPINFNAQFNVRLINFNAVTWVTALNGLLRSIVQLVNGDGKILYIYIYLCIHIYIFIYRPRTRVE